VVYDVVIIGGGVSGLTFAYECEKFDISCLVLEASERLGGCVHSYPNLDGMAEIELGAHTLYSSYAKCIELIETFDLQIKDVTQKKILVKSDIDDHPRSLFRNLRFFSALLAFSSSIVRNHGIPRLGDEPMLLASLSNMVGTRNMISFFKPLLRALYNQSPEGLPSDLFLKARRRSKKIGYPKKFTLAGGIESLIQALATRVHYKLQSRAEAIQAGELFLVKTRSETYWCRSLVFAIPASSLAQFPELVEQTGYGGTANFETSVLRRLPEDLPAIVAFDSAIAYSEIIQRSDDSNKVCHHPSKLDLNSKIFLKQQQLPDLSNRVGCHVKKPNVYLIGNHFSGLALEDCVAYAHDVFLNFKTIHASRAL